MSETAPVQQPNTLSTLGRFVFWFSLVVAAIAVYYFFLIERGSEHVYRRSLRSLTQIERQINSGFDRFAQVASTQAEVSGDGTTPQQIDGRTYSLNIRTGSGSGECSALKNPALAGDGVFKLSAPGGNALIDFCVKAEKSLSYAFAERIPLADFINASVALEQFHQILVFDNNRNLIYRSGDDANDLIKSNIYDLLDQNVTSHEAIVMLPESWLRDDDKKASKLTKSGDKNADSGASSEISAFSKVHEFTIGEQKYLAFIRPMKLDYATAAQPDETPTWYVVGITPTAEFNASRFVVPRWWMAIFLLALALFILGTPYLKLRLLGPRDLIRSSTVLLTLVAMLFATMIITIMLLNLSAYFLTENSIRDQLRSGSQLMANAFSRELAEKKAELRKIATIGPTALDKQFIRCSVFDADGQLTAIWSSDKSVKANAFSVKKRNFWQQLAQRSTLPVDDSDLTYSLDNILNRIDGRKMTVLATRVAKAAADIAKKPGWNIVEECTKGSPCEKSFSVATGLFTFDSFAHALLPKGYGYIVIDNGSGIVQYHSESSADLIEQLYEETDNNAALKTAVNTGSPDTFLTNYRGHRYLFHTRPLSYAKWTLVTYFSQELFDRVNLGLLLSATGLSVGFLLLYMCGGLLGFRFLSHSKINLLWPNPSQAHGYRLLLILLSTLTLAFIAAIAKLHGDRLFSIVVVTPLVALSGAYICLVKRYQPFQTLLSEKNRERDTSPMHISEIAKDWRALPKDWIALLAASVLVFFALLAASDSWPWQLLPYSGWATRALGYGSGFINAAILMTAAYLTLLQVLRTPAASERNGAADTRRALLNLSLLTASVILIANLPLLAAIVLLAVVGFIVTQALWSRDSSNTNQNRTKFFLPIDRRSDREKAYVLHRLCITLIVAVLVMLPAVAFYRDATSLYMLRWLQQDGQKLRAQVERALQDPRIAALQPACVRADVPTTNTLLSCDLGCRFQKIVAENECNGLLPTTAIERDSALPLFSASPRLTWLEQRETFTASDSAELRLMRPITALSRNLARISGFSKIESDPADDARFSMWQVTNGDGDQHLRGTLKLSYTENWLQLYWRHYADFGFLSKYERWIWLTLAAFAAAVIYPMVRLILRELIAEADLRPYPVLTPTELDLLLKNYRNTLLLVSGNSLDKAGLDLAELENDTVLSLKTQFAQQASDSRAPIIAALPNDLDHEDTAADIMVVAEQRWQTLSSEQTLQRKVRTRVEDANPPTWEALLESINKLRYPDDVPDLALDHWKLDRTCTLLVCRNIEAQATLAAYAAEHGWHPQTLGKDVYGEKIWLHNIEDIIFKPSRRKHLLGVLENLHTHEASRSIVLTSLILPHLWLTEKAGWHGDELNECELTRWLTVLTRMNVRTVNALTIEHTLSEINRSYHALPRPSREAEYALWWRYSTADERTALAALTHEGLINPYNRSVIRSLMARGLIFRGSTLRFSDKAFRLFVKHKYPVTHLRKQADIQLQQSSWGAARGPLLITVAILGYGVMVMGGGAFETMLGLATSIGAAIPALLNLTRLIKKDSAA